MKQLIAPAFSLMCRYLLFINSLYARSVFINSFLTLSKQMLFVLVCLTSSFRHSFKPLGFVNFGKKLFSPLTSILGPDDFDAVTEDSYTNWRSDCCSSLRKWKQGRTRDEQLTFISLLKTVASMLWEREKWFWMLLLLLLLLFS